MWVRHRTTSHKGHREIPDEEAGRCENKLEAEPMDIPRLRGGWDSLMLDSSTVYNGFRIQEWPKDQGEQQLCGCQPSKLRYRQECLSPECSPGVFVKLPFRTELLELHLFITHALQGQQKC